MFLRRPLILVSILLLLVPVWARAASGPGDLYLRLIEGDVQMQMEDTSEWVPAAANTPLFEGDKLWVPDDGKADVRLRNGVSIRLGPATAIETGSSEGGNQEFYLDQGVMYGNSSSSDTGLTIYTPDTTVRIDFGSIFNIRVRDGADTQLDVMRGTAYVVNGSRELRVDSGKSLILRNDGRYSLLVGLPPEDEWLRWNRQRDRDAYGATGGASARYLPDELAAYGTDLDRNGRWVFAPEYGYVWTPRIVVTSDWSPYRIGRWVWIRGDYVWVSYEPWGWVPYHYGRWAHVPRFGWCWVPPERGAVYWAPAYVGWVSTATEISWVPLAPREVYYGRGYFGPHSVNISRGPVNAPPPKYRNVRVSNAVTTVHVNVFLSGRPAESRVRDNPFLNTRPSFGAPNVAPARNSIMPVIKDIPRAKLPPVGFRTFRREPDHEGRRDWRRPGGREPIPREQGRTTIEHNGTPVQQRPEHGDSVTRPGERRQETDHKQGVNQPPIGLEKQTPPTTTRPVPSVTPELKGVSKSPNFDAGQGRARQENERPDVDRQKIDADKAGISVRPAGPKPAEGVTPPPGQPDINRTREHSAKPVGQQDQPAIRPQQNPANQTVGPQDNLPARTGSNGAAQLPERTTPRQLTPPRPDDRSGQVSSAERGEIHRPSQDDRTNANNRIQPGVRPRIAEERAAGPEKIPTPTPQPQQTVTKPAAGANNRAEQVRAQGSGREEGPREKAVGQERRRGPGDRDAKTSEAEVERGKADRTRD